MEPVAPLTCRTPARRPNYRVVLAPLLCSQCLSLSSAINDTARHLNRKQGTWNDVDDVPHDWISVSSLRNRCGIGCKSHSPWVNRTSMRYGGVASVTSTVGRHTDGVRSTDRCTPCVCVVFWPTTHVVPVPGDVGGLDVMTAQAQSAAQADDSMKKMRAGDPMM